MCIDEVWRPMPEVKDNPAPVVGEECEVEDRVNIYGFEWYYLKGYDQSQVFRASMFAILPDQTADEINAQHKEAILM